VRGVGFQPQFTGTFRQIAQSDASYTCLSCFVGFAERTIDAGTKHYSVFLDRQHLQSGEKGGIRSLVTC
jgi:hypothetical protein